MMEKMFVAIETSKRTNIGTLLRCAVAFGSEAIIIVGDTDYGTHGAHGAQTRIKINHFYTWSDFHQFALENNYFVYGIVNSVIDSSADSTLCSEITATEFKLEKSVVFVVGNKFGELSTSQKEICDEFIVVPFCGGSKFSRYVLIDTKLSICLHHYADAKGMIEGSFVGEKYLLSEPQQSSERFESKSSIHRGRITSFNCPQSDEDFVSAAAENVGDASWCTSYLGEFNMFLKDHSSDY